MKGRNLLGGYEKDGFERKGKKEESRMNKEIKS